MLKLKITSNGRIALKKEVLDYLGAEPGGELEIRFIDKSRIVIEAIGKKHSIEGLFGMMKNRTGVVPSIEEINEAIEAGWAGEVKY